MKHFIIFVVAAVLLVFTFKGGCYVLTAARCPRVLRCSDCGATQGIIGALLPGQQSNYCRCGGWIDEKRLTVEEWREAEERGYVTW